MPLKEGLNNTTPESDSGFATSDEPATIEKGPEQKNDGAPALPPEEGLQGWLCVLGAFLGLFCSFGFLNAYVPPHSCRNLE